MVYVCPLKPRFLLARYAIWPAVFCQVLWLHPRNGVKYAARWANASLHRPRGC
jgi:hypothetical protein